jgi:hypothetical protein
MVFHAVKSSWVCGAGDAWHRVHHCPHHLILQVYKSIYFVFYSNI